MHISKPKRIL